jgi:hypothetical protein
MKYLSQFGLVAVFAILTFIVPVSALAARNSGVAHPHNQSVHDRTPTVHIHGTHSHHHQG